MKTTKKFLTAEQALDYFEQLDSDELSDDPEIITLPPEPSIVTDEEDIEENNLCSDLLRDVSGEVEISVNSKSTENYNAHLEKKKKRKKVKRKKIPVDHISDESDNETENRNICKKRKKCFGNRAERSKSDNKEIFDWSNCPTMSPINKETIPSTLEEEYPEIAHMTPFEIFRMFFDDEIISFIIAETERYANQKNNIGFTLTEKELWRFLGIILFSGYHSLPQEDLYWAKSNDCNIPFIHNAMSRQRFRNIKKNIHLCNNDTIDLTDKLAKVRLFIETFCKKLQQFGVFSEFLCVDEEMIPYTGHHSAKMYMRSKPIKFGYKMWVLASSEGYPFNLQVYIGKEQTQNNSLPLGTRVVLDLTACIPYPPRHELYIDNFFTSVELLLEMRARNFRTTGTIRENRLKSCPVISSKELKKKDRGTFDSIITDSISIVKWKDNQVVCLASNFEPLEPISSAKRWNSVEKKKTDIPQPHVVASYNKYMGGVDLLDRFLSQYRPKIKGKKWWWPFFTNTLNMAVVAAWRIHRECKGKLTQLEFLREITTSLMKREEPRSAEHLRPGPSGTIPKDIRFDGINHFLENAERQSRCRVCMKNTRLYCKKCNVMLHKKCLAHFHSK